jgi:hypothetical protein
MMNFRSFGPVFLSILADFTFLDPDAKHCLERRLAFRSMRCRVLQSIRIPDPNIESDESG